MAIRSGVIALPGWALVCLVLAGCSGNKDATEQQTDAYFRDLAGSVGLDFVHVNGASTRKYLPDWTRYRSIQPSPS